MTAEDGATRRSAKTGFRIAVVSAMLATCGAVPAVVAAACGGVSVTDKQDPTKNEAVVTPDGGRVDGPLGSYIIVPAGALTADTRLSIAIADDSTYEAQPDAAIPRGAVFAFTPHGQVFLVPAEIGIPSSATPDELAVVLRAADSGAPWTLGPQATFDEAGFATFNTSQLSLYAVVGTGDGGIEALFPGGSACSPDQRDVKWAAMLAAPITLPGRAGTLDLAGPDKTGISAHDAEAALCGGVSRGPVYGDDTETVAWGPDGDFAIAFDKATQKARFAVITGGYTGSLEAGASGDADAGADGGAGGFSIRVGMPLTRGGAPVVIPWSDPTALGTLMNELELAMLTTFFPNEPAPATACDVAPVRCNHGTLGSAGYIAFPKLGVTIWVGDTNHPDRASTPSRIDV
ncbi:MAG TPA: hypothetical protein VM580_02990, partial [Labilithrix sp.]|nr:hypothetical protein [Labilithrix sp.]